MIYFQETYFVDYFAQKENELVEMVYANSWIN